MLAGQLLVGNASSQATPVTITGDITIAANGAVTITNASINTVKIANDAVDRSKINGDVAGNGLSQAGNGSLEVNLGGDVITGSNTLSVVKLRGNEIAPLAPLDDQVLKWDSGSNQWVPADISPAGGNSTIPKISTGDGKPLDGDGKVGDIYIDDEKDVYIKISNSGTDQWLKVKGKT